MSQVKSVVQLTPIIRKKAHSNIWQRRETAFDLPRLHELIQETFTGSSKRGEDVFERLRQIDLNEFVRDSPGEDTFFTCSFFVRRYAWISRNENGEYRYFSKVKNGYGYYAFDLFDLLSILTNQSSVQTASYLKEQFSVEHVSRWGEQQQMKYETNREAIKNLTAMEHPSLMRLLRGGIEVYDALMQFGAGKIKGSHLSDEGEALFFLSTSYLKEHYFPKKSISTLNQWMNLFAILGLIKKNVQVPIELQTEAEKQQLLKRKHNHVSFYAIPSLNDVLELAESRALVLAKNRISYHQITKKCVQNLFGDEVFAEVYIQKTHGRKVETNPVVEGFDLERMHAFFQSELHERGFATKETVLHGTHMPMRAAQRYWKQMIVEANCTLIEPTPDECKEYGILPTHRIAKMIPASSNAKPPPKRKVSALASG